MFTLERLSKTAAIVSVLLIVLLLLVVHPDLTGPLLALMFAAIVVGAIVPARAQPSLHLVWVVAALLSPAVLRLIAHREGPVLDLFWMAGLSASLVRSASWSQWRVPAQWRVLVGGWALIVSLAWPVLLARETGFDLHVLRDDGAINSWAFLSAPHVVAWLMFVAWTQLLGLLWLEWAYGQFEESPDRVPIVVHGFWIGATLASAVAVYQGTVDIGFLSTPFWASLARATGTLLDANAFGVCAALAGPVAFLALHDPRTLERALYGSRSTSNAIAFFVFVVNIAGLWMSGSRAAMLCAAVSTAVFFAAVWSSMNARARRVLPWVMVAVAILVATVVTTSTTVGPARRLSEIPASLRNGFSTIFDRPPYGPIANQMIREHPIAGIGMSSYQILSPDYWRTQADQQLPFDNAQNWWRHQLSEFGVLGSAGLFLWSAIVAWQILSARPRAGRRLEATIVRGLVAAVGVASLIQVPTQTPIVMLGFMLLLGWSNVMLSSGTGFRSTSARTWQWAAVTAIAVAYGGAHLALAKGPLAVAERARRAHHEYAVGTYPPEVFEGHDFRWTKGDATFVWPARTRWLVVRIWAQHPDLGTQPVRATLTSQCGVLFDEDLKTPTPIGIGVTLPAGEGALLGTLKTSRTWRPSDHGSNDERELGVAIVAEFVTDPGLAVAQNRVVSLSNCPGGI